MTSIYIRPGTVLPERRAYDHYPTPRWAVEAALNLVAEDFGSERPTRILDVGAGEGIWGTTARKRWPEAEIVGVEKRKLPMPPAYDTWVIGDFLGASRRLGNDFDLVMGNPPFSIAVPIIEASFDLLRHGGRLALFLRLAFLEGQGRRDTLYRRHPLKRLGVYSKRVSFQEDGKTNATAHALFLWELGYTGSEAFAFF